MTNVSLADAYLRKATDRLDVLDLLHGKRAYSDVVREAQEIVELALKAMLRSIGVEPPKWHDVGSLVVEHADKLPEGVRPEAEDLATISKRLRKERELAFYGDIDFIPTEEYSEADSLGAIAGAKKAVAAASAVVQPADAANPLGPAAK